MKNYLILLLLLLVWPVLGGAGVPGLRPGVPGLRPGVPGLRPGIPGLRPGYYPGLHPGYYPGLRPGYYPGLHPGLCGFNRCAVGDGACAVDYAGGRVDWFNRCAVGDGACGVDHDGSRVGWFDRCAGGGAAGFRPGKDFALFFAVNDYVHDTGNGAWKDLSGPVRDARELAADLHDLYGFDTAVVVNPTLETISATLRQYGKMTFPADGQLFVFFSGHGNFLNELGEGFFIPRNGKRSAEDATQATWLSLLRLRRQINQLPCPHILLAIDACYSGTLDDRVALKDDDFERMGEGTTGNDKLVSDMLRVRSRLYFTSGGRERTPDPSGFASQWKAALRNRGGADGLLTLRELEEEYLSGARIQPEPKAGTFEGHEPGGKFVFVYQPFQTKTPDDTARDRAAWNTAKNTGSLEAYRKYEKDFLNGDFINAARQKIADLDDQAAWYTAKSTGTVAAYDDFLNRFPHSDYADAARANRDALLKKPATPATNPDPGGTSPTAKNYTDPIVGTMVYVKGGSFDMGCTNEQIDCGADEEPVHRVTLNDYYIGQTEVTQAQWKTVMKTSTTPSYFTCDDCPVEQVSWEDVQTFIQKLNARSGGGRYRLLTEAEWEYAARGGPLSNGYLYAGSNNIADVAWYVSNSSSKTHPVKGKKANELGLYDMSGNVWEWCSDWYGSGYYGSSPSANPTGPKSGSHRVIRGGSWYGDPTDCRVADRGFGTPGYRGNSVGFRLARTF